jgi:hypothetical protein
MLLMIATAAVAIKSALLTSAFQRPTSVDNNSMMVMVMMHRKTQV